MGEDYRTRIGPLVASGQETRLVHQTQSMCGHLVSVKLSPSHSVLHKFVPGCTSCYDAHFTAS